MRTLLTDQRGSVLIIAVIAMLIMGVLSVSYSLLASLETTIGFNYKNQAQAEALAEAALARGRDLVRNAGAGATGFTDWFNGTQATHLLLNGSTGISTATGTYWARIDNDCNAVVPAYPSSIEETAGCTSNAVDTNEKGVITAWAVSGNGRSRVRAVVKVDDPWKHVCSASSGDFGGYCNDTQNTKGNPSVIPADPNDENGPKPFPDLPRPIVGCSRIDPTVHGQSILPGNDCDLLLGLRLYSQPATTIAGTTYPAYPVPAATVLGGQRLVIMGEDPNVAGAPATIKSCGRVTVGGIRYFGYFDCALRTPCPLNLPTASTGCGEQAPAGSGIHVRKGCIIGLNDPDNPAVLADPKRYHRLGVDGLTCGVHTGTVWVANANGDTFGFSNVTIGGPDGIHGSDTSPKILYLLDKRNTPVSPLTANLPKFEFRTPPTTVVYGTVVVEGNVEDKNKVEICTAGGAPSPLPANPCPAYSTASPPLESYGFPLAVLAYSPKLPYPTVTPHAPQPLLANFATPNTVINGIVYSGGKLSFNPINVNGSSVAFDIDLQATSSTYKYIPVYGNKAPPAAFPAGSSNPVSIVLKSFITCSGYGTTEASAPTTCN